MAIHVNAGMALRDATVTSTLMTVKKWNAVIMAFALTGLQDSLVYVTTAIRESKQSTFH